MVYTGSFPYSLFRESMKGVSINTIRKNSDFKGSKSQYFEDMYDWWQTASVKQRREKLNMIVEKFGAKRLEAIDEDYHIYDN